MFTHTNCPTPLGPRKGEGQKQFTKKHLSKNMPQFDIASFYPQIPFFAVIFLLFYVLLTKNVLPKISRNLKLAKRISENFGPTGAKDLGLLSLIYEPSRILSLLASRESLALIYLERFTNVLSYSYLSSLI